MPRLIELARNNDLEGMEKLLQENPQLDLNEVDEHGSTALIQAAQRGYVDIAKWLVFNGADVSLRDNLKHTALHFAVLNGHAEVVKELLQCLGDQAAEAIVRPMTEGEAKGRSVLHLAVAATQSNAEMVKELLQYLEDQAAEVILKPMTEGWWKGYSLLHVAVSGFNPKVVKELLQCLGDQAAEAIVKLMTEGESKGWSALHLAVQQNDAEMVKELLQCLGDQAADAIVKYSLLYVAVDKNYLKVVKELLQYLGDQAAETIVRVVRYDCSALHLAVVKCDVEVVKVLLQCLGDQAAKVILESMTIDLKKNFSLLHVAIGGFHLEVVKELLRCLGDQAVETMVKLVIEGKDKDSFKFPEICWAVVEGDTALLKALLVRLKETVASEIPKLANELIKIAIENKNAEALKILLDTVKDKVELNCKNLVSQINFDSIFKERLFGVNLKNPKRLNVLLWVLADYFSRATLLNSFYEHNQFICETLLNEFEQKLRQMYFAFNLREAEFHNLAVIPMELRYRIAGHALRNEYPFLSLEFCEYCMRQVKPAGLVSHYEIILDRISRRSWAQAEDELTQKKSTLIQKCLAEAIDKKAHQELEDLDSYEVVGKAKDDVIASIGAIKANEIMTSLSKTELTQTEIERVLAKELAIHRGRKRNIDEIEQADDSASSTQHTTGHLFFSPNKRPKLSEGNQKDGSSIVTSVVSTITSAAKSITNFIFNR